MKTPCAPHALSFMFVILLSSLFGCSVREGGETGCVDGAAAAPGLAELGTIPAAALNQDGAPGSGAGRAGPAVSMETEKAWQELAALAAWERRLGYRPGMGQTESFIYDALGRLDLALLASGKDMIYGRSQALHPAEEVRSFLELLALLAADLNQTETVRAAALALEAYFREDWKALAEALSGTDINSGGLRDADSFSRYLGAVADLALNGTMESYEPMQARYAALPDYWFWLGRFGNDPGLARHAAERCIVLSPGGFFNGRAREILALGYGLSKGAGKALLVPAELEDLTAKAVAGRDWESLKACFPLLALEDNPLSLFALGMLKGLASDKAVRSFLLAERDKSSGRLAERLNYAASL